jgi:hypothetical protein
LYNNIKIMGGNNDEICRIFIGSGVVCNMQLAGSMWARGY